MSYVKVSDNALLPFVKEELERWYENVEVISGDKPEIETDMIEEIGDISLIIDQVVREADGSFYCCLTVLE